MTLPTAEPTTDLRSPFLLSDPHMRRLLDGLLLMTGPRADWATLLRRSHDLDVLDNGWLAGAGRLVGLLSRGWRGLWKSGPAFAGVERTIPTGVARVEWQPFDTGALANTPEIELGPLEIRSTSEPPIDPITLSELMLELSSVRRDGV